VSRRPIVEGLEPRELLSHARTFAAESRDLLKGTRGAGPPVLALSLLSPPGDSGQAIVGGKTKPKSLLKLDVGADGSIEQTVKADKKGKFQFKITVGFGSTPVEVIGPGKSSRAPVGRLTIVRPGSAPPRIPVDIILPSIRLDTPVPGGLTNSQVRVTGQAAGGSTGLDTVFVRLDDGPEQTVAFDAGGAFSYTTSLPRDGSADGPHVLQFGARNRTGISSATARVSFTLDTTPPATPALSLDPASDTAPPGDNATTAATITLDGTTDPGAALALVGGSQTAVADAQGRFQLAGLPLDLGAHTFTVRATDPAGNASQGSITITRNAIAAPSIASFAVDTPRLLAGTATQVVFTASVANAAPSTQVVLHHSDASGTVGDVVAPMLDDGDPLIKDARANDGVYSNTFAVQEPTAGDDYFAAVIPGSGAPPTLLKVTAVAAPSMQRLEDLSTQSDDLNALLDTTLNGGATGAQALDAVKQALLAQPDLTDPASIVVTDEGIAWSSNEGIESVLMLDTVNGQPVKSGPAAAAGGDAAGAPAGPAAVNDIAPAATSMPMLCGNARVLSPNAFDFGDSDEGSTITSALRAAGVMVDFRANAVQGDQTVTLDDFKNFGNDTAVAISSHGEYFPNYGFALDTGVAKTLSAEIANLPDLITGRLVRAKTTFGITSRWVSAYSGQMNGTIVYLSACRSTFTGAMANAFLDNGAGAYFGYDDYVSSAFSFARGNALFTHLISGGTVGDAPGLGTDDPSIFGKHATFELVAPDATVKLPSPCGIDDVFVSYRWQASQRDLDTGTTFLGVTVGYSGGTSPYLDFSGDDTSTGGTETVRVHLKDSHDAGAWTDTVTIDLAAGWYIPAGGSGPALVDVALIDPTTGELMNVTGKLIDPGAQEGLATTPVGLVTITLTGDSSSGMPTETFTLT
jgi:hypothetical protein